MPSSLVAGAATADITPTDSTFLFGYPHVPRYSSGVHDPLLSSALYLADGRTSLLMVANDVIFISRQTARRVRDRIESETGVPASNMMITATHTHSGPLTADMLSNEADVVVPKTDPRYLERLEGGIVRAAVAACRSARPAQIGAAVADGSCVGTNRHDPAGPADPQVPVLAVRDAANGTFVAAMLVCSMHPTVLHEDSTVISGDFPGLARQYLGKHVFGAEFPILYHTGPCGNQSPRHVAQGNTLDEAKRLGEGLGRAVAEVVGSIDYTGDVSLDCAVRHVTLPFRSFPSIPQAQEQLNLAVGRLAALRRSGADRGEVRTAECDWFGAEESLALARAAAEGRVDAMIGSIMPAEIQLMRIGRWSFVGWPGESFVEFSLEVKAHDPRCQVISLANGELQGYLATAEAVRRGTYEAKNGLFANPAAGMLLVAATLDLLDANIRG
jgi:neutral ceramidase